RPRGGRRAARRGSRARARRCRSRARHRRKSRVDWRAGLPWPSILELLRGAGRTQPVEDQQSRAYGDRRIGEIESPEMPTEGVKIEKIHHVAERDPIPEFAVRPAEYQGSNRGTTALD